MIALTTSDGVELRARRSDGRWSIERPFEFPADGVALDAMASALAEAGGDGAIESPQPLAVYGLAEGASRVEFEDGEGRRFALLTGREAPVGSKTYVAREGAEAVYAVPSWRMSSFDKTFQALRDARIQPFDRESIREIVARWPDGSVRIVRAGEVSDEAEGLDASAGGQEWRLVEPLEGPADDDRIESLLTDLMHLRADGFVDEPLGDDVTGLATPALAVELARGDGEEPLRVAFGASRDGLRVVRGRDGALYELASERLDDFPRTLVEYRDRTLSRFATADVSGFEMVFVHDEPVGDAGPGSFRASVTRASDGGDEGAVALVDWQATPPLRDGVAAEIVSQLARLQAVDIRADWLGEAERAALGLEPARATLRVFGVGEPAEVLAEVRLGRFDAEQGIVAMAGGRDEVFQLDADVAEKLPTSRQAFEERFAAPEPIAGPPDAAEPEPRVEDAPH